MRLAVNAVRHLTSVMVPRSHSAFAEARDRPAPAPTPDNTYPQPSFDCVTRALATWTLSFDRLKNEKCKEHVFNKITDVQTRASLGMSQPVHLPYPACCCCPHPIGQNAGGPPSALHFQGPQLPNLTQIRGVSLFCS
jgi:hypothetical protein